MDNLNFNRLLQSVEEAKEIMQGKKEPSRRFVFKKPNTKDIRVKHLVDTHHEIFKTLHSN